MAMKDQNRLGFVCRLCLALAAAAALLQSVPAGACQTPVYRYAMYNWAPSPYYVFYLYWGEPAEEDKAVNELIVELAEGRPAAANVYFRPIDVSQEEQMERLPGAVRDAWQLNEEAKLPAHLVFTPWGQELFTGRLDEAAVQKMVDSPARAELGKLLDEGPIAVLLMLPGADEAENTKAEEAAKELIARAADGKIMLDMSAYMPPPVQEDPNAHAAHAHSQQEDSQQADTAEEVKGVDVGFLKVDRADEAEDWLIRSLMMVEQDLPEFADKPMIFATYGRGRALEPYVGKGITADNLEEVVYFLGSACSCQVKEQNPGADLLVKWDWDATADRISQNDPSLIDDYAYQEYPVDSLDELVPPADESTTAQPEAAAEESAAAEADSSLAVASVNQPASVNEAAEEPESPPVESLAAVVTAPPKEAAAETSDASEPEAAIDEAAATGAADSGDPGALASRQIWTYGIGLAIATLLVAGAGFVMIRKSAG